MMTYRDPRGWNDGLFKVLAANGLMAPFDRNARQLLAARFSTISGLVMREQEMQQRMGQLRKVLQDTAAKWSLVMDAHVMRPAQLWRFSKFLATFNESYLEPACRVPVPMDDLDIALPDGDVVPVAVEYIDMLKVNGPSPRYFRTASLVKMPHNPIGIWSTGVDAPVRSRGNFMFATSFTPLTEFAKALEFRSARNRLERIRLDLRKLLMGDQMQEKMLDSESYNLRQKRSELEKAEAIDDRWGTFHAHVTMFGRDPGEVVAMSDDLHTVLTTRGLSLTWENAGLPNAYETLQAGGHTKSVRSSTVTVSRAAAIALVSKSSVGSPTVPDLNDEEAVYVLETEDGNPFYYSPYVGGKAFALSVGPTRSGKTFFKNTISAHFMKYPGAILRAIDIDPGTETLARFYGEEGGVVRLEAELADGRQGMNPFVTANGAGDQGFVAHMLALSRELLQVNDSESQRVITRDDQKAIDHAVLSTLALDNKALHTLSHMVSHMPQSTSEKFDRWMRGGAYDGIFNSKIDGIGSFDRRIGVVNLAAYRDIPSVLRPILFDLFYRVTRLFEAPSMRQVPKQLDIDEAHHLLSVPQFREYAVAKVRTWAKWQASMTMWSQSPAEYKRIDGWDAVRGAASTYIFLADGKMDDELYKDTFKVTNGICKAIRQLVPRREAFIVQPEAGIAKKVILRTEPEQSVINTSHPVEVMRRDKLIAEHGMNEGLRLAVEAMQQRDFVDAAE